MLKIVLSSSGIVALVQGQVEQKLIRIDVGCISKVIRDCGLGQHLSGLDIMSAILSTVLAVARYVEKFGSVEGICLDYVLREWCSQDPHIDSLIASSIGMMLYGIVRQSVPVSSEDLVKLIDKLRDCVKVNDLSVSSSRSTFKLRDSDRSMLEF